MNIVGAGKRRVFHSVKFHENLSIGSRVVSCGWTDGRTDRHDEANSRFSQFGLKSVGISRLFRIVQATGVRERSLRDITKLSYLVSTYITITVAVFVESWLRRYKLCLHEIYPILPHKVKGIRGAQFWCEPVCCNHYFI
jgi:hypothetical protein